MTDYPVRTDIMHSIITVMRAADELAANTVTLTFSLPDAISWRVGNADVTFPIGDHAAAFAARFDRAYRFDPDDDGIHTVRVYDVMTD